MTAVTLRDALPWFLAAAILTGTRALGAGPSASGSTAVLLVVAAVLDRAGQPREGLWLVGAAVLVGPAPLRVTADPVGLAWSMLTVAAVLGFGALLLGSGRAAPDVVGSGLVRALAPVASVAAVMGSLVVVPALSPLLDPARIPVVLAALAVAAGLAGATGLAHAGARREPT